MNPKMIRAYLEQRTMYYSESKDAMIPISTMPATHAANAAEKLIREAGFWAHEAMVQSAMKRPAVWMASRPVVQALVVKAAGIIN